MSGRDPVGFGRDPPAQVWRAQDLDRRAPAEQPAHQDLLVAQRVDESDALGVVLLAPEEVEVALAHPAGDVLVEADPRLGRPVVRLDPEIAAGAVARADLERLGQWRERIDPIEPEQARRAAGAAV